MIGKIDLRQRGTTSEGEDLGLPTLKRISRTYRLSKEVSVKTGTRFPPYNHTKGMNGQWSKLHVSTAADKSSG
jgi:hypothetical protein